jgi:hypothetical protein
LRKNFVSKEFIDKSLAFFTQNSNIDDHDKYFENFTPLWNLLLGQGSFLFAEQLWQIAVASAKRWDSQHETTKVHKGAAYYFWGVTCILKEDLEKGFLLMHQALEEDKTNINICKLQNTPAYSFVTLNYAEQNQYFRNKVLEVWKFLEMKLKNYETTRNGLLTSDKFNSVFLKNLELTDQAFLFVFELFHTKKLLSENGQGLTQNVYGSMVMVQSIFTFSLIIDNIIKHKYTNREPHEQGFLNLLGFLSKNAKLNLDESKLRKLGNKFTNDFECTLDQLIKSRSVFKTKLQPIEEDIAICYGFRNSSAHKIKNRPYIDSNFNRIVDRLFNVFFLAVEKLYE